MLHSTTALIVALLVGALLPAGAATAQSSTGTITGTVSALDGGGALADVCVEAIELGGDTRAGTRSGTDGGYRLTELPPGVYVVMANACEDPRPGYVPSLYEDGDGGEGLLFVEGGATASGVDVALPTAGTITGRVTAADTGEVLEDVCVRALTDGSTLVSGTRTGADGSYELTTAPPGENQVIFVECRGPRTRTPEVFDDEPLWPLRDDEHLGSPVTVQAGTTTSDIDADLALGASVEGQVRLFHTHAPAVFQFVGAWHDDDVDDLPTALAITGLPALGLASNVFDPATDGRFDFAGLPAGSYTFEVGAGAFDPFAGEVWRERWYGGADEREDADRLTVRAGEEIDDLLIELVPSPDIEWFCPRGETRFPDVPASNTHSGAIECMADADIARGGQDGRYRPAEGVRRDQMAAFLTRLLLGALPYERFPTEVPDAFRDDDGNPHEDDIDLLAAMGIVEGDASGRYRPASLVGRGQMATFLARTYELATGETLRTPATSFRDVEGTQHATSIRKVAVAAIAAGTSATTYEPNQVVRRDQMATFLARLQLRLFLDSGLFGGTRTMDAGEARAPATARRAAGIGRENPRS